MFGGPDSQARNPAYRSLGAGAPHAQAGAQTSPPPHPSSCRAKGLLLLRAGGGEGREGGGLKRRLPSNPPDKGEGEGEAALFGAKAGAGEWADSLAAWPTPEPTQPDLGRKRTEINQLILHVLLPSLSGPESPPLENEMKALGRHSSDLPHHSSA